jgi:hypothetical protein
VFVAVGLLRGSRHGPSPPFLFPRVHIGIEYSGFRNQLSTINTVEFLNPFTAGRSTLLVHLEIQSDGWMMSFTLTPRNGKLDPRLGDV